MQESPSKSYNLLKNTAAILYVIATSAFLPIACSANATHELIPFVALALCVFGFLLCVRLAGVFKPILPFVLITVFLFLASATVVGASITPLIFLSVAIFAYLYRALGSHLLLLVAIPSYAIAFLVTDNYILSLLSLVPIIAGAVLNAAHKTGAQRVEAICKISSAIGVSSLVIFLSFLYIKDGSLDPNSLRIFFDTLKVGITDKISEALVVTTGQIASDMISSADLIELASVSITAVFNLLPAIIIIALFIISYIIHSLYIALIIPIPEDKEAIQKAVIFKMSVTSAVLFLLSFLASLILSGIGKDMYSTVAQNIYVIFFPGLSLIAVGFILGFSRGQKASCLGLLFNLALIGAFIYVPYIAFPIASFIGAAVVIISALKERKKNDKNI